MRVSWSGGVSKDPAADGGTPGPEMFSVDWFLAGGGAAVVEVVEVVVVVEGSGVVEASLLLSQVWLRSRLEFP